jgi:tellurite resistance protein TehA-like permease
MARISRSDSGSAARIAIRNFTSQWFLIPQGTGIIAVTLHNLDYQFDGLGIISIIFWVITILLLLLFLLLYTLRIILFPKAVTTALATDIIETAGLASISITFTVIIQMIALTLVSSWSPRWGLVAYILWWINTAMAIATCIGIPYVFVKYEPPGMGALSPATQLPLIASLTAAAGGAIICTYGGLNNRLQVPVIIVSYLLIGMGLPLSLGFDSLFLTRLMGGSSPSGLKVYQDMILCGPWGQGSFALQALGEVVMNGSFAGYGRGIFLTSQAATPVGYASIFAGLIAWAQGTFWWAFACISILHMMVVHLKNGGLRGLEFGLPIWAVVFPWVSSPHLAVSTIPLFVSPKTRR